MPSRRHPIAVLATALVIAAACVGLGSWQLQRLADRRALNAQILAVRSGPPTAVGSARDAAGLTPYERVSVEGRYDPAHEVLVYGRPLEGRAGHDVVTPLVLPDGSAILVVRGWVPFGFDAAPVLEASPVTEEVTVEGFAVPDEGGRSRPDARGIVRTLDVRGIAATIPYDVAPLPVQLRSQDPAQPGLPTPVPPAELSEGPHLSYAIQWFSFAAIALVGAAVLIRRDRRATAAP